MPTYLLGLGSNIRPDTHLKAALSLLQQHMLVIAQSPMVDTTPVGDTFSFEFKNQLVVVESPLNESDLKQQLLGMEERLGREPKSYARQFRDRPIDIDILASGDSLQQCLNEELEESYYASVQQAWLTAC